MRVGVPNFMYTRMVHPMVLRPHAQSSMLSSSPASISHASNPPLSLSLLRNSTFHGAIVKRGAGTKCEGVLAPLPQPMSE